MIHYLPFVTAFISIYLTLVLQATAQWSGALELGSGYDDNAFNNSNFSPSSSGSFSLDLGYFPEESHVGLSYSGLFASYSAYPERRYSTHMAVASYSVPYGDEDVNALIFAGSFALRTDAADFRHGIRRY